MYVIKYKLQQGLFFNVKLKKFFFQKFRCSTKLPEAVKHIPCQRLLQHIQAFWKSLQGTKDKLQMESFSAFQQTIFGPQWDTKNTNDHSYGIKWVDKN